MSTNNQLETVVPECLACGYVLRGLVAAGSAKCPECGNLIELSQKMARRIDQLSWQQCVQLRRGVNIFCLGIAIMLLAFFLALIMPGLPWLHLGGTSIGIIVAAAGAWKLSSYYLHRKAAFLPFVGLRLSVIMLSVFLIAAMILLMLIVNPPGPILPRAQYWNVVWLGLLIGVLLSLGLTCFFLLHSFSSISSWCSKPMLGAQISKTRLLTIIFGIGMLGMFIWNANEQPPTAYERTIFNIRIYQTYLIFLGILSLVVIGSWGQLIYSLRAILKVPKEFRQQ